MAKRYYCPACGQVAGFSNDLHIARVRGEHVESHFMISRLFAIAPGMSGAYRAMCPGGPIDKERDRAP